MSNIVSLDGVSLESVSPFVRIADVIELQPGRTTSARERLGAPGSIITRDHLASKQVRVQFALLTSDQQARTSALSDIAAWAMQGRYLSISDRPGQRLKVICTASPITMSKRKWTELCEMTFTAYDLPFWEDASAVQQDCVNFAGATSSWPVYLPSGNVRNTPLSLIITPTKAPLTAVSIAVNGAEMAFSGLSVPVGSAFTISYPEGYLTAVYTDADGNAVHCLGHRTGDEYLPLQPKVSNEVTFWADVLTNVTFSARGWYW